MATVVGDLNHAAVVLLRFRERAVRELVNVSASGSRLEEPEQTQCDSVGTFLVPTDQVVGRGPEEHDLVNRDACGTKTRRTGSTDLDSHTDGNTPCGCLTTAGGGSWQKLDCVGTGG